MDNRSTPGMDPTGSRKPVPDRTNMGATSIPGSSRVSRTNVRRADVRRRRRPRAVGIGTAILAPAST